MNQLARFRSVLRRLFPGKEPRTVLQRRALARIAEHRLGRPGATVDTVLERVKRINGRALTEQQLLEMRLALERDLPPGGEP